MLLWLVYGFAVAVVCAAVLIAALKRLNLRQRAYELAPQTHREKSGTPTMGGLVFVVAFAGMLAGTKSALSAAAVFLVCACAGIGAVDDALTIWATASRGLRARTKLLATALVAAIFLRVIGNTPDLFPIDVLFHSGTFTLTVPHWLWLVLGVCAITGTIHAVNLTDGLDGLAAGSIIPPLVLFGLIAFASGVVPAAIAAAVGVGACAGFLLYNLHPAKLFMGDTGSLALGALLSGVAILTGEMLLLVLAGGVFVAETLSVMLQVSYFKLTKGKRIFRMSPLHHHFELAGWRETKVTSRFWLASLLCSLLGWVIVR
ncbi:MAG TPA: phospho-N-acetylmuramoyl-pentapeptide-transferase [Candidatus Cybelea sp.]|jgi:phospho-N-acetylmuramoyl-pentapeptide-transferase|nr:phospho-N-acetylmuramoyl-pentapeptide-transferase [Candidatus Cybelea sp.]